MAASGTRFERIVVADTAPAAEKAGAFNHMEQLRDPAHVRALTPEELVDLYTAAGLRPARMRKDLLPYELEGFLARSFPKEGDADRIRQLFAVSLDSDSLGVVAVRKDGQVRFSFPTAIIAATVPGRTRSDPEGRFFRSDL